MKYLFLFTTFRHLKFHKIRTLLTVIGIALGVAIIVAIDISNRTTYSSLEEWIRAYGYETHVQLIIVPKGWGNFSQDVIKKVSKIEEVKMTTPSISGWAGIIMKDTTTGIRILGIDISTERKIRKYELKEGVFLNETLPKNSILISESFAKEHNYKLGDKINLISGRYFGILSFEVKGILKNRVGPIAMHGGKLAIIRLDTARVLFNSPGMIDKIDIVLEKGASIELVKNKLTKILPATLKVEKPTEGIAQFEQLLRMTQNILSLVSTIAIFVGMLMIYNTMSIAVVQRRKEIGILRALGAKRAKILLLFLIEGASLGFVAALFGLLFGILLSYLLIGAVAKMMWVTEPQQLLFSPSIILVSLSFGIITACLASAYPAYQAIKVNPLSAIRHIEIEIMQLKSFKRNIFFSVVCIIIVIILLFLQRTSYSYLYGAAAVVLLGFPFILLSPFLITKFCYLMEKLTTHLLKVEGKLAILNIIKSPYRNAVTVVALMIAVGMMLSISSLILSLNKSILGGLDKPVYGDIVIYSSSFFRFSLKEIQQEFIKKLKSIKGVESIGLFNFTMIDYKGKQVPLFSLSMDYYRKHHPYGGFYKGNKEYAIKELEKGTGILISTALAHRFKLKLNDIVHLQTPTGRKKFKVVGIVIDYGFLEGNFLMARSVYKRYFKDDDVTAFNILLKEGYAVNKVKQEIEKKYAKKYYIDVLSDKEIREEIKRQINQQFAPSHAVKIIVIIIAVLGILNTMLISTFERTREIGILRAIGSKQKQILKMVIIEAIVIGLFAAILGIISGLITSYILVNIVTEQLTGYVLEYALPYLTCGYAILLTVIFAIIAAYYPAKRAANINILEALQYE